MHISGTWQKGPFIVSLSTTALSHGQRTSAGASCDSWRAKGHLCGANTAVMVTVYTAVMVTAYTAVMVYTAVIVAVYTAVKERRWYILQYE